MAITDRRVYSTPYSNTTIAQQQTAQKKAQEAAAQRIAAAKREATKAKAQANAAKLLTSKQAQLEPQIAPKQIQAEAGESLADIANRAGVALKTLLDANPDTNSSKAGVVLNVPPVKYTNPDIPSGEQGEYGIVYEGTGINPKTFSEFLGTAGTGDSRRFQSGALGSQYGYGDNEVAYSLTNTQKFGADYVNPWWQNELFKGITTDEDLYAANEAMRTATGSYDPRRIYSGGTSYVPTGVGAAEQLAAQKERDTGKYYQEGMFEMPGMALYNRWEQDKYGKWVDRGKENYFDDLYEANGIDPTNQAEVEAFWSYADDDLLMMGEFFDIIEWPSGGGGYGGYGAMPTPSRQYGRGSGQSPRGDYASYLSLTSWSI